MKIKYMFARLRALGARRTGPDNLDGRFGWLVHSRSLKGLLEKTMQ
jgi:hypothetical protein